MCNKCSIDTWDALKKGIETEVLFTKREINNEWNIQNSCFHIKQIYSSKFSIGCSTSGNHLSIWCETAILFLLISLTSSNLTLEVYLQFQKQKIKSQGARSYWVWRVLYLLNPVFCQKHFVQKVLRPASKFFFQISCGLFRCLNIIALLYKLPSCVFIY